MNVEVYLTLRPPSRPGAGHLQRRSAYGVSACGVSGRHRRVGLRLLRQQHNRASRVDDVVIRGIDFDLLPGLEEVLTARKARIDCPVPASIGAELREPDPLRFVVAVQNEEQAVDAVVLADFAPVEVQADPPVRWILAFGMPKGLLLAVS